MERVESIGIKLIVEVNGQTIEGFIDPGSQTIEKIITAIESGLDPTEVINFLTEKGCDYLGNERIQADDLLIEALCTLGPDAKNLLSEHHPDCDSEACSGCS